MSITGVFANRKCQQEARKIISRYTLRAHKAQVFSQGQPWVLTGIAKTRRGQEVSHRRAKAIAMLEQQEGAASTTDEKLKLLPIPDREVERGYNCGPVLGCQERCCGSAPPKYESG